MGNEPPIDSASVWEWGIRFADDYVATMPRFLADAFRGQYPVVRRHVGPWESADE